MNSREMRRDNGEMRGFLKRQLPTCISFSIAFF